jgi:hypothetical protein
MTPREKVVFKQPCEHCQRMTTVDLTALASGSGDHAELEAVAEEATAGPWNYEGVGYADDGGQFREVTSSAEIIFGEYGCVSEANAAFIAAANPATVLALLAENAALRERLETARIARAAHNRQHGEAERKLAEAVTRLERWEPKPFCQPSVSSGTSKEAERE